MTSCMRTAATNCSQWHFLTLSCQGKMTGPSASKMGHNNEFLTLVISAVTYIFSHLKLVKFHDSSQIRRIYHVSRLLNRVGIRHHQTFLARRNLWKLTSTPKWQSHLLSHTCFFGMTWCRAKSEEPYKEFVGATGLHNEQSNCECWHCPSLRCQSSPARVAVSHGHDDNGARLWFILSASSVWQKAS